VLDIGLHLHLAISGVEWSRNLASIPGHPPIINHFITVLRMNVIDVMDGLVFFDVSYVRFFFSVTCIHHILLSFLEPSSIFQQAEKIPDVSGMG
jgi:hypothetical protein